MNHNISTLHNNTWMYQYTSNITNLDKSIYSQTKYKQKSLLIIGHYKHKYETSHYYFDYSKSLFFSGLEEELAFLLK